MANFDWNWRREPPGAVAKNERSWLHGRAFVSNPMHSHCLEYPSPMPGSPRQRSMYFWARLSDFKAHSIAKIDLLSVNQHWQQLINFHWTQLRRVVGRLYVTLTVYVVATTSKSATNCYRSFFFSSSSSSSSSFLCCLQEAVRWCAE